MAKCLTVLISLAVVAVAEPPVGSYLPPQQNSIGFPSNQYGPPSNQYGPPSSAYGAPSSQYGAPSSGFRNSFAPLAARAGPSSRFGAPGSFGGPSYRATPASSYGAPGFGSYSSSSAPSRSYGTPSSAYGAPAPVYGAPGYNGADPYAEPANYQFSYDVNAPEYGVEFGHQESRQYETAKGSYYVLLPDGRKQVVEYIADEEGYRPTITYTQSQTGYSRGGYSRGPSTSYGVPQSGY